MRYLASLTAMVVSLSSLACATAMSSLEELETTVRNFHHHLVAQSTDHAAMFVAEEGMEAFEGLHDPAMNVNRLEEYTVVRVRNLPVSKEDPTQRAIVSVNGSLRKTNSITIQYVRYTETWQLMGKDWKLVDTTVIPMEGGGRD